MAETLIRYDEDLKAPNGESSEDTNGEITVAGIGTLEEYNDQLTGEPVDLAVVELFAAAGDQVAQAYLDHVAAMDELIEK